MKKLMFGLMIGCLCLGCSQPGTDDGADSPRAASDRQEAVQDATTTKSDSVEKQAEANQTASDAEQLLTTTLAQAKRDNKRVMVHLGAPW